MVKTPEFERPLGFGASSGRLPIEFEKIRITPGAVVDLRYKGKTATIRVTKVVTPQSEFIGEIEGFDGMEFEHQGLKSCDEVRFAYDKIQHIHKWTEEDGL